MGQEFEVKYAATEEAFAALAAAWPDYKTIAMETTYYDTTDGGLSARKITLRRRLENNVSVCTLKTPGQGHVRGEWELNCGDIHQAIPELCRLGAPKELESWVQPELVPVCGARFTRRAVEISLEGTLVELALDQGILLAGSRQLPFQEAEVELKQGSQETALAFARALAARYGLTPEPESKFRRAQKLREG